MRISGVLCDVLLVYYKHLEYTKIHYVFEQ